MSPLHAPGATIAHPGFVNTACKEEAAIKVLRFPRRIRGDARVMGVQLEGYLDGLVSGIPCSCRGTRRASFTWSCQRMKDAGVRVCLHLPAFLSSLFHSLYFFLCLCLEWMTSLCKCGTLVFKARKNRTLRWLQMGVFKCWSTFRCACLESDRNCVTFAAASEEWGASCQIRTKQHGYAVFLGAKLLNSI